MSDKAHAHRKPKHRHGAPLERELAARLTVAVLGAARSSEASVDELAERAAGIYRKMLSLVATTDEPEPSEGSPS